LPNPNERKKKKIISLIDIGRSDDEIARLMTTLDRNNIEAGRRENIIMTVPRSTMRLNVGNEKIQRRSNINQIIISKWFQTVI